MAGTSTMQEVEIENFPDDFLSVFHNTMHKVSSISEFKDVLTSPTLQSTQTFPASNPRSSPPSGQEKRGMGIKNTSDLDLDGLGSLRPVTSFHDLSRPRTHSLLDSSQNLPNLPHTYSTNGTTFTTSNFALSSSAVFPEGYEYEEVDEVDGGVFAEGNFYEGRRRPVQPLPQHGGESYGNNDPYESYAPRDDMSSPAPNGDYYDEYANDDTGDGGIDDVDDVDSTASPAAPANGKRQRKPSMKKMQGSGEPGLHYGVPPPPRAGEERRQERREEIPYQPVSQPVKISEEAVAVFNPLSSNAAKRPYKKGPVRTLLSPLPPHLTPAHVAALTSTNWVTACQAANSNGNVVKDAVARSTGKHPGEDGGKKRRMNLSAEDRAKQNRDRNREHARNTRLRKKAYVEELKRTLTEMVNQREQEYKNELIIKRRTDRARDVRLQVLTTLMNLRGSNCQNPDRYYRILEQGFEMTMPQTPYRQSFKRKEGDGRSKSFDSMQSASNTNETSSSTSSVHPAHPHDQNLRGVPEVMEDASYLATMISDIGKGREGHGAAQSAPVLTFHPVPNTINMDGATLSLQFNSITAGAIANGAPDELRIHGMCQATFDTESNMLVSVTLAFDTFSVAYQLSTLTPGSAVVSNSAPGSPVARSSAQKPSDITMTTVTGQNTHTGSYRPAAHPKSIPTTLPTPPAPIPPKPDSVTINNYSISDEDDSSSSAPSEQDTAGPQPTDHEAESSSSSSAFSSRAPGMKRKEEDEVGGTTRRSGRVVRSRTR